MQIHHPSREESDDEYELNDLQFEVSTNAFENENHLGATESAAGSPPLGIQMLKGSTHPIACIFHCVFKILSLVLYVFNGLIFSNDKDGNFITITVCCMILLAMDFWVVKNITGRLLVGLRWWTKVSHDGTTTEWIFESSSKETSEMNLVDSRIFWTVLYATPFLWSFFFVTALTRWHFGWMITVIMALILSGSNVYGYWKCSSDQKAKFTRMMTKGAEMGTIAMVRNNFFGLFNRKTPSTERNSSSDFV